MAAMFTTLHIMAVNSPLSVNTNNNNNQLYLNSDLE